MRGANRTLTIAEKRHGEEQERQAEVGLRKINFLVAHGSLFLIRFATSDGAVSSFSNVAPEFITKLYELAHSGKMEEATKLFNKIRPLSDAIYHKTPLMQHWVVEKEALTARAADYAVEELKRRGVEIREVTG